MAMPNLVPAPQVVQSSVTGLLTLRKSLSDMASPARRMAEIISDLRWCNGTATWTTRRCTRSTAPNTRPRQAVTASAGSAGATLRLLRQAREGMGLPSTGTPAPPINKADDDEPKTGLRLAAARRWALLLARIYECLPRGRATAGTRPASRPHLR